MKKLGAFLAVASMIFRASLSFAEDYRVIQKISVPADVKVVTFPFILGPAFIFAFSPNGSKIAYMTKVGKKWSVWIDDRRISPEFDGIEWPVFSPDGSKVAYMAESGGEVSVWINDRKVLPEFAWTVWPVFSPDSSKVAYVAIIGEKCSVWINDRRISPEFNLVWLSTFSPDGSKVAYEANSGGKYSVWINDRRISPEFDDVSFVDRHFNKTGELIFAGYDKEKREILHAVSLVTEAVN